MGAIEKIKKAAQNANEINQETKLMHSGVNAMGI
jgi:hypothetical protein